MKLQIDYQSFASVVAKPHTSATLIAFRDQSSFLRPNCKGTKKGV
jgi:hypothetical protein